MDFNTYMLFIILAAVLILTGLVCVYKLAQPATGLATEPGA